MTAFLGRSGAQSSWSWRARRNTATALMLSRTVALFSCRPCSQAMCWSRTGRVSCRIEYCACPVVVRKVDSRRTAMVSEVTVAIAFCSTVSRQCSHFFAASTSQAGRC